MDVRISNFDCTLHYGRVGNSGVRKEGYEASDATDLLHKKGRKGYKFVEGVDMSHPLFANAVFIEAVGSNSGTGYTWNLKNRDGNIIASLPFSSITQIVRTVPLEIT